MLNKSGVELLKTYEAADELGQTVAFVQKLIREGKLKAIKSGKVYLISRKDLNTYLGIENNDESLKKDLLIAELKSKNENLEMQIRALKALFQSASEIVSI